MKAVLNPQRARSLVSALCEGSNRTRPFEKREEERLHIGLKLGHPAIVTVATDGLEGKGLEVATS
jgi:hypothetical protein